jgi:pantoate--beta-alanine ligase
VTTTFWQPDPATGPATGPATALAVNSAPARTEVRVYETIASYSAALDTARRSGLTVGVVPTMGALHEGHRSLIRRAAEECDLVAVSIFVNPTQFGDVSDLANYPRTWDADLDAVEAAGGHLVFAPSVEEMYPDLAGTAIATATGTTTSTATATGTSTGTGEAVTVTVPELSGRWEGASRPGHFDGVATVVVKLLTAAGRCRAYFGEKDYQQLAVVRRVVRDLSLPTEVVGCQTVRDEDGLALSSRNVRLAPEERRAALALSRALRTGAALVSAGEGRPAVVEAAMERVVAGEPLVELDYAVVVHADDLEPALRCSGERPLRLLIAGTVGPVRLIDNLDPAPSRTQARSGGSGRRPAPRAAKLSFR